MVLREGEHVYVQPSGRSSGGNAWVKKILSNLDNIVVAADVEYILDKRKSPAVKRRRLLVTPLDTVARQRPGAEEERTSLLSANHQPQEQRQQPPPAHCPTAHLSNKLLRTVELCSYENKKLLELVSKQKIGRKALDEGWLVGAERAARKEAVTTAQNQQSATGRRRQSKKPQMTENERKLALMLYTRLLTVPDLSVRQKEQFILQVTTMIMMRQ